MQFGQLIRREFISLLGSAAAWPLVARAQQPERIRRVGILSSLSADDPETQTRSAALLHGLQQLGWTVGRNLRIDIYAGANSVTEMVALAPDVIVTSGSAATAPALQATRTVPIVFVQVA